MDHCETFSEARQSHALTYPTKCNLLYSADDFYDDVVFDNNCKSIKYELLKSDQHPPSESNDDMSFCVSESNFDDHHQNSPSTTKPISQDFVTYNITPVDTYSNDSEITIHTLNFNSTYSDVSPRHSHHFSDGLLIPKKSSKVVNSVSSDGRYHLRGNSVTHNITVC